MMPNLFLLSIKIISIFFITWLVGWSVSLTRMHGWLVQLQHTVVGAVTLNLLVTSAIVIGIPGKYGLLVLVPIFLIKFINRFKSPLPLKVNFKGLKSPFYLISAIVILSYAAPMWTNMTSGLYSRGGGDHSGYLGLSDYFQEKSLWNQVPKKEIIPTLPNWETKTYPNSLQHIFTPIHLVDRNELLPLGNQMIATPYMVILPGNTDETYTAVEAFYAATAVASVIGLLFALSGGWSGISWIAFIPIALSNLLLYPSGTHSTPFLFAISILNVSLLIAWQLTRESIHLRNFFYYIPAIICGGGLLTIYPFLFVTMCFFYGVFAILSFNLKELKNYFILGFIVFIGSLFLTHFYLLINIPLILFGASSANSLYHPYTLLQLFSTQSGLIDFLMLPTGEALSIQAKISIVFVVGSIVLSIYGYMKRQRREIILFFSMLCVFFAAALYFNLKDEGGSGGYQMVRFATLSHLYLLCLAALGIVELLKGKRWQLYLGFVLIGSYVSFAIIQRASVVNEVVKIPHAFGTEFRDAGSYRIREELFKLQKTVKETGKNRIVYYFGHGDGTDFGGSTVFMRPLYALNAFNLEAALQNTTGKKLWNKEYLKNAFLMYSPVGQREILIDKRNNAATDPIMSSARLSVWDSASQNIFAVLGESWNYPIPYDVGSKQLSFRYLRGRTGALVIWSDREENIKLSIKTTADSKEAVLQFHDLQAKVTNITPVNVWAGDYQDSRQITNFQKEVKLSPGPNVFEITPKRASETESPAPWLLVFEIAIENLPTYDKR